MSPQQQGIALAGGIIAVLAVATFVGWVLKAKFAPAGPHAVIDNLNARVKAWWAMATILGVAFWLGKAGIIGLFTIASFIAFREYATIAPTRRGDHWVLLLAFFVVIPFQYLLVWIEWYGLYSIFVPVYAFLLLPVLAAVRGDVNDFLQRAATTQWGLMVSVFCLSHVPALLTLEIPGYENLNGFLLVYLVLVVQSSDVFQYVWGKLAGRRKIAPEVSPSKTVEGFVGGIATATLLGTTLWWMTPFSPLQAAAISLALTLMGFFGGLVMSAIKRDRGVKDWGTAIQGHGGVLDRLDSVCFSAPIFFHVVRYWWTA
jgi:phosphatidate cytidylyltransferase